MAVTEMLSTRRGERSAPGPVRRVHLPLLAAAVGLALLVTLLVLWGFGRASDRREVLMVTAPVAAGQPIPAGALGSTFIALDSGSTQLFSAQQRDALVGKVAAIGLKPGDLLGPSMVSPAPQVAAGWLEVGAVLKPGRFPTSVIAGDRLLAYPLQNNDATSTAANPGVEVVVVKSSVGDTGTFNVVLATAPDTAADVAQWAAGDRLVVVREAQR